jgi:hypothetical protein
MLFRTGTELASARLSVGSHFDPKGLRDAQKELGKFTEEGGGKFKAFAGKAALAFAAIGAGAVVVGKKLIDAGENAATSNARIDNIVQSMGLFSQELTGSATAADDVTKRLIDMANATARLTGVDQNSIKATQAKLATFQDLAKSADEVGGNFDRATMAALDLAAAGFGSAEGNAVQLGKALQDPIKGLAALSKSGVTFTDAEKERIKTLVESNKVGEAQVMILEAIEKQVGGTAEATANASDRMRVGFSQLSERLGLALLPVFEKFVGFLLDRVIPGVERIIDAFNENGLSGVFKLFTDSVSSQGPKVLDAIKNLLGKAFEWIRDTGLPLLLDALQRLGEAIVEWVQPRIVPFLVKLGEFIAAGASWVVNVGLPMLAEKLATLAEELVAWIGPKIPPMLAALGEFIGRALTWIIGTGLPMLAEKMVIVGFELVKWILNTLPDVLAKFLEWSVKIGAWFITTGIPAFIGYGLSIGKGIIDGIVEAVGKFIGMLFDIGVNIVNGIVDGIKSAAGSIGSAILGAIPGGGAISGALGSVKNLLPFKSGGMIPGPVNRPMPILAHGGEYVLSADIVEAIQRGGPSRGLEASTDFTLMPMPAAESSGGGATTVVINTGLDESRLVELLRKYTRLNGPITGVQIA